MDCRMPHLLRNLLNRESAYMRDMDPAEIRRRWRPEGYRPADGSDWDGRVPMFDGPVPGEDDPFVSLVLREGRPDPMFTDVLDIGCGTGIYSLALSGKVRSVTGVDISPAMIGAAVRKAESLGIGNAEFRTVDWSSADTRRMGKYGITIAHMTPAICSAETFAKMLAVSRGTCFLAGYVSRENPIWDGIYRIVGKDGSATEPDKLLYAQDTLWKMGLRPRIEYIREHRSRRLSPEQAYAVYLEGTRGFTDLGKTQEDEIRKYLDGIAEDGYVRDSSDPLIGVLYWDMSGEDD